MEVTGSDRRSNKSDRRARTLAAYWHGALNPRRRAGRRDSDRIYPIIDWHSSRVFALILMILLLCVADGVLTIVLMSYGAVEANPVMALFVPHELGWFAAVKLMLTAGGMIVLTICSRMRVFRTVPGEVLLYAVLAGYVALIVYELRMFDTLLMAAV
jgi:Domain of unknown function (DUF5658)